MIAAVATVAAIGLAALIAQQLYRFFEVWIDDSFIWLTMVIAICTIGLFKALDFIFPG
jgi:hypothetical protein